VRRIRQPPEVLAADVPRGQRETTKAREERRRGQRVDHLGVDVPE
jgi:hypothetical protein